MTVANINSIQGLFITLLKGPASTKELADLTSQLNSGVTITKIATDLIDSPEGKALFGGFSNGDLIDYIYSNAFGRVPDSAGKAFWIGKLGATPTSTTKATVVVDIINFASPADKGVFNGKVDVAKNATHQLVVQELYVTLLGRAADIDGRTYWVGKLNTGTSVADVTKEIIASEEAQDKYAGLINSDFVAKLYSNAFGRAADAEGLDYWVGRLNSSTRAAVTLEILGAASDTDRQTLNNKVDVAQGITDNFQTQFTLTTETDNLTGTSGKDLFTGDNGNQFFATVQAGDKLDGGAGIDTFKYYYSDNGILPTLLNVEKVELINLRSSNIDFSPLAGSGLEEVTLKFNPQFTFTTVAGLRDIKLGIDNVTYGGGSITGNFGNGTTASVSLTDSTLNQLNIQGNKVTTINLDLASEFTDGVNRIDFLTIPLSSSATGGTLNITGDAGLGGTDINDPNSSTVVASNPNAITTVNAAENTGGVKLSFTGQGKVNFTGGKGDDSVGFAFNQFDDKSIVDGGDGKDTLRLTSGGNINATTAAALAAINGIDNVEVLSFDATTVTVDAAKITAVKEYDFVADTVNLSGATTVNKFTLNNTGANTLNLKGKGQSVDLTLKGKVQTLNLQSEKGTDTGTEKNEITNLTTDDTGAINPDPLLPNTPALTISITGNKELKIASPVLPNNAVQGVDIDAEDFDAKLDITGTDQDDTFTGGTGDNIFIGRSGNNSFTAGDGKNDFTGGKDKDTFIFDFANFNTSVTDIDKVDGGDGKDTLLLISVPYFSNGVITVDDIDATTAAALAAINGVKNVEVLGFNAPDPEPNNPNVIIPIVTVDATKITAVKEYDFLADIVDLSGAATVNKFTLNRTNDNNVDLNLTGKGQSVDLTLKGNVQGNVQTLNLDSSAGTDTGTEKNEITNLTIDFAGLAGTPGTDALIINITGDKELKIASPVLPNDAVQGINFNATAFTAKLEATGTDQDDTFTSGTGDNIFIGRSGTNTFNAATGNDNFTGGKDKDTFIFDFANFNTSATDIDKVDGGDGIDTLQFNGAVNVTTDARAKDINDAAKLIEVLRLNSGTVDVAKITAVKDYEISGNVTVIGATESNKFTVLTNNSTVDISGAGQKVDLTLKGATVTALTLQSSKGNADPVPTNTVTQLKADGSLTLTIDGVGGTDRDLVLAAPTLTEDSVFTLIANTFTAKLTATGGAGNDTLTGGTGSNTLTGGAGDDSLTGGVDKDSLTGGAGKDTLRGGAGADSLTGGTGNDIFAYDALIDSNADTLIGANLTFDTITDFTKGQDTINVAGLGLGFASVVSAQAAVNATGITDISTAPNFTTVLNAASTAIDVDELGYFVLGGNTYILSDDDNNNLATGNDLLIKLSGFSAGLAITDFTV
ncbi:MAG: beta strand repeat-containing protein [Dolichospermum sp.]